MKTILIFLLALSSLSLRASEFTVEVYGRSYVHSCGYYSNESADLSVNFIGWSLPMGTRIFATYGWKGYNVIGGGMSTENQIFEWAYKGETELKAVAPYQWRFELHQVLHNRTSNQFLDSLQFGLRVEKPGQTPEYFPRMAWSFYEARAKAFGSGPCVDSNNELPNYSLIAHKIIER